MARPGTYPDFAQTATGTQIATPDSTHVNNGFTAEFAPFQWFNFLFKWISAWIRWLDETTQDYITLKNSITEGAITISELTGYNAPVSVNGWYRVNASISGGPSVVTIAFPKITGTSNSFYLNSNAYRLPVGLRPSANIEIPIFGVHDNGSSSGTLGAVFIRSDGLIAWYPINVQNSSITDVLFTASGTKTIDAHTVTYSTY